MRVAVNVEQLLYRSPGGIGRYTAKLLTLLPELFAADTVVPFAARHPRADVDEAWDRFGLAGVDRPVLSALPRPVLYDAWHVLGAPPLSWRAPRLTDVDVVHAPSVAVPPKSRSRLVVTVHDVAPALFPETFPARGRWFHRAGLRAAAQRADVVIAVSQSAAAEIADHSTIAAERIRIVPNGVDAERADTTEVARVRATFGLGDAPYVLWVGSLEPRKDVGTLVAAMAGLLRRGGQVSDGLALVLVGDVGWMNDGLIDPGNRAALGRRLRRLGRVSDGDLRALYAGASLFGFPSRHEGFGLPVLEAMAQGTPVLCSDIPVLREVAGAAASFIPPGHVLAWTDALEALLGSESERARLADAGLARARVFSWERTVRATHALYREVLG
jgi:glycosyltransferase involved in cell wall biosynthesis